MKVSFERVNQTIKKLPVGYYLGKEVEVNLLPSIQRSRFLINEEKIEVSYPQIALALEAVKNKSKYEKVVRSNFYHELGHSMLTPRNLDVTDPVNIFEDERIERKLDGYFYGVDFKEQVSLINSSGGDSPIEKFFDLVRFRIGPSKYLRKVEKLLSKYDNLNATSDSYPVRCYEYDIENLYREYTGDTSDLKRSQDTDDFNSLIKVPLTGLGSDGSEDSLDEDSCIKGQGFDSESEDKENLESSDSESDSEGSPSSGEAGREFKEQILKEFERTLTFYDSPNLTAELLNIFESAIKVHKANSSALNSYSGVFDPRSVVRKDCKYFLVRGRGDRQNYSKINLNLFVDRSGSMCENVQVVNEIIHSLYKVEKISSNFTFNLITLGYGERLEDKKDILYDADGGNCLDPELFKIYKKVQIPKAVNYNLVLFDGYTDGAENFKAFNSYNTVIVSDTDNEGEIKKYAPSARKIFIKEDYANVLVKEMLRLLRAVVR